MSYTMENTICSYINNEQIESDLEKLCSKYNLDYRIARHNTDLIALPYFIAFLDAELLTKEFYSALYLQETDHFDWGQKWIAVKRQMELIPKKARKYFSFVDQLSLDELEQDILLAIKEKVSAD